MNSTFNKNTSDLTFWVKGIFYKQCVEVKILIMIEFKNVEIKYGDFVAIENINLQVEDGDFFTLLGPSGCGKTTTLRSLVGFIEPTQGDILIGGKRVNEISVEKRGISMVFQSYALFPTMNVYDNIAFGLTVQKHSKKDINNLVKDIAKKVELTGKQLQKKVSELSGGQQQRVAIARALVLKPKILVLDEPLSNLDASLRIQLRSQLKKLQKSFGITTIYVTHDQEEALTLSDKIAVFNKGKIEQIGTPEQIYNESETEFVCNFIGNINKIDCLAIEHIVGENDARLDCHKDAYVRLEKVLTKRDNPNEQSFSIKACVVDSDFFGTFTEYTYQFSDYIIKNIEKEDGRLKFNLGDEVELFINPEDVMQF